MNKFLLLCTLMIGLQLKAETTATAAATETANPPTEIAVTVPAASDATAATAQMAAPASVKELKETEIPVQLEATKKSESADSPIVKFVLSFAIIGILGAAAYFLLRKYKFKNPQAQAAQIKVLTQHYLGPKKSLAIVRVAGESVLIGITDHNISMIKSLSLLDEDIPEESPKEFQSVFAKKTAAPQFAIENEPAENRDEFSISGIKDIVSGKLKNMRSLE